MLERHAPKLRSASRGGDRSEHASILLPFLIIAAGVGVLAWWSYQLSVRMEHGAKTVAIQYAAYASEITARRLDAAVRSELGKASDEWQQVERVSGEPTFSVLQQWINRNDWIVSAIYVPDADPASSVYVSEIPGSGTAQAARLSREFYTSSGTVRYRYDPERLLGHVRGVVRQQPLAAGGHDSLALQQPADVSVVRGLHPGLSEVSDGFVFVTPLTSPLAGFSVRAVVRTWYIGSGWANQGLISLLLSLVALTLTGLGVYLTMRGTRKERETAELRAALVANVSHELRTPLSMIRLGAETLRRGAKLTDGERREIEEQILREVLHLSHLVENVLDVARMQHRHAKALAFSPVYPRDLLVTLVSTYESWIRSKGFSVSLQIDDGVDEQMWDREAVSRAVLNLIDNAIKYSADEKAIEVALRQDMASVIIEVRDRGIGIDAREISRIFDPYYRAQFSDTQTRRGAGLGLTLVQQIVTSHGGGVEVESQPGEGSTFRLHFPRAVSAEPKVVAGFIGAPETL